MQTTLKDVNTRKLNRPTKTNYGFPLFLLLLIGIGTAYIFNAYRGTDFLDKDEEGNIILSEKRQQKLEGKLQELQQAEQYALLAEENMEYPCYCCPNSSTIFLYIG